MFDKLGTLPQPLQTEDELVTNELLGLDALEEEGDVFESEHNVFIAHNLGYRVFTMSVPMRDFYRLSEIANDRDAGEIAQRPLDIAHAKKLAVYILKGLVGAARMKRVNKGRTVSDAFESIIDKLGKQPYNALQPIVCNIRGIPFGGDGGAGIRGERLQSDGKTVGFKIYLARRHRLWVIDGQHRRKGADMVFEFLDYVRSTGKYPAKSPLIYPDKGTSISNEEMEVWNEAYDAAQTYAFFTVETHLGLDIDQERQLFHDLNRLGKKVDASLAMRFDSSNPIIGFIKDQLHAELGLHITETESRDWADDSGGLLMKDIATVTSIAFLNKSNVSGATPAICDPRKEAVQSLWSQIAEIPSFGESQAKIKTVAAQPVVLKALAKLCFDLNFSNRRPDNGSELFDLLVEKIPEFDWSHQNPIWRYYEMTSEQRKAEGLESLELYLPDESTGNRDIGSFQDGIMRFGAKHNDIYPIIGDMIRWKLGLPNRHQNSLELR